MFKLLTCYGGHFLTVSFMGQVQEKKVKRVCQMNVAPSHSVGNGSITGSSTSNCSKSYMANGGCNKMPFTDASLPCGGVQSLHLPVVVVLVQSCFWHIIILEFRLKFPLELIGLITTSVS